MTSNSIDLGQYDSLKYNQSFISHEYGKNVFILSDPLILHQLSLFSHQDTRLPLLNTLIRSMYERILGHALNKFLNVYQESSPTRMQKMHPKEGHYHGPTFSKGSRFHVVDIARAGTYPAHVCFEYLHQLFPSENLHQDHIAINRELDSEGKVIGAKMNGSKITPGLENSYVLFPDPMAATGGTLSKIINHYKEISQNETKALIALHLIGTPEYIEKMSRTHPDLIIFLARLDRGFSTNKALNSTPGKYPNEEKGLNNIQYIVPGAGGVGEILNNEL